MASVQKYSSTTGKDRYRVRWIAPDGHKRSKTFDRRGDADTFRDQVSLAERTGGYVPNPTRLRRDLDSYWTEWIDHRVLSPRTRDLYRQLWRSHIGPTFGRTQLGKMRTEQIRRWHAELTARVSPTVAAKSYRLLRVVLATAVEDRILPANPCTIRNAGVEHAPERPLIDMPTIVALADAIEPRYRAAVLLAGLCGLRRGEILALRRRHIDLLHTTVRVEGNVQMVPGHGATVLPPKSHRGNRTVTMPRIVVDAVTVHLDGIGAGPDTFLWAGVRDGKPQSIFPIQTAWTKARAKVPGVPPGLHIHDMRHASGTAAAQQGATTRELMDRLGHASPAAAMRYQHAATARASTLAERLDQAARNA